MDMHCKNKHCGSDRQGVPSAGVDVPTAYGVRLKSRRMLLHFTTASMTEVVCPGKRLGRASEFRAGPGTYVRGTYIYASVVGPKVEQAAADEDGKPFLVVSE